MLLRGPSLLALPLLGLLATACISAADAQRSTADAALIQQLIVKFKPSTIACDANGIARVSALANFRFELVRPMSGDACVIRQLASQPAELARGLAALGKLPFVEWAEPDTPVRAL